MKATTPAATTEKEYEVCIMKQHPAWDERDGIRYTTKAKSKMQAIRYIRRQSADDGHTGPGCGRCHFSAKEVGNE